VENSHTLEEMYVRKRRAPYFRRQKFCLKYSFLFYIKRVSGYKFMKSYISTNAPKVEKARGESRAMFYRDGVPRTKAEKCVKRAMGSVKGQITTHLKRAFGKNPPIMGCS
jgi:hypothetical protein